MNLGVSFGCRRGRNTPIQRKTNKLAPHWYFKADVSHVASARHCAPIFDEETTNWHRQYVNSVNVDGASDHFGTTYLVQ